MGRCGFASGMGRRAAIGAGLGALVCLGSVASGEVIWSVSFQNPQSIGASAPAISAALLAAGAEWSQYIVGNARLDVQVIVDSTISRAAARSATSSYLFHNGQVSLYDQGAAAEIRTGIDPNGLTADIELFLSPSYLANELWFDPDPLARTAPVPTTRTDAVSVFMHELGHAIGFNGWRDERTGALPGYASQFDALTVFDGTNFFFHGPEAIKEYGAPVPLTYGNIFHLGNNAPRPGSDLRSDLMNGVVFQRGTRYDISRLDLAIMSDLGLDVTIPEVPSPGAPVMMGIALLLMVRRKR